MDRLRRACLPRPAARRCAAAAVLSKFRPARASHGRPRARRAAPAVHGDERHLQSRQGRQPCWRGTTAAGCSASATCCGTPTARSKRCRPNTASSPAGSCRRAAGIPSSPTCAPPGTRWIPTPRRHGRATGLRTLADLLPRHSRLRLQRGRAPPFRPRAAAPRPHAPRHRPEIVVSSRRMPARSSAGPFPRPAPCCAISTSTPPSASACTPMSGRRTTSSCGTIG